MSLALLSTAARSRAGRQTPAWRAWLWWLTFAAGVGVLWWALPL